jgi:hypothetical protein
MLLLQSNPEQHFCILPVALGLSPRDLDCLTMLWPCCGVGCGHRLSHRPRSTDLFSYIHIYPPGARIMLAASIDGYEVHDN